MGHHARGRGAKIVLGNAINHGIYPAKTAHPTDIDADRPLAGIDLSKGAGHAAQDIIYRL
ncbi:hypothetical protein D3C77_693980 [compost metagenome]